MIQNIYQRYSKELDSLTLFPDCLLAYYMIYCYRRHVSGSSNINDTIIAIEFIALGVLFFCSCNSLLNRDYSKYKRTVKRIRTTWILAVLSLRILHVENKTLVIILLALGIFSIIAFRFLRLVWKSNLVQRRIVCRKAALLIVTTKAMLNRVSEEINGSVYKGYHIAGIAVVCGGLKGKDISGVNVVADGDTIADYVCREWVDQVIIDIPGEAPELEKLIEQFVEMGVEVKRKFAESDGTGKTIGRCSVVSAKERKSNSFQLVVKRLLDIAGGLAGCLVVIILLAVLAPAIYLQSPGPILFSQIRIGKNGRKFKIYKFRSMHTNAEERKQELLGDNRVKDGMMFKLDYDPRIIGNKRKPGGKVKTGLGEIIRKLSLDEFPQFFNVLIGDMSLVGTRPPTLDEWGKYEFRHRARLAAKPGITGLWQVCGRSNITDFEEVVRLDKKYIDEWKIWLDIKIIFKTVLTVFRGIGAM